MNTFIWYVLMLMYMFKLHMLALMLMLHIVMLMLYLVQFKLTVGCTIDVYVANIDVHDVAPVGVDLHV